MADGRPGQAGMPTPAVTVDSRDLLQGQKTVAIAHNGCIYRLQATTPGQADPDQIGRFHRAPPAQSFIVGRLAGDSLLRKGRFLLANGSPTSQAFFLRCSP